jgi:hypothetical protein
VDWTQELNSQLGDRLVEIHSEHGSSECVDPAADGCAWGVNAERHVPWGAVQAAWRQGLRLGLVGGTDNHEGRPGSLEDGPGVIASARDDDGDGVPELWHELHCGGSVTGAFYAGEDLDRPALFDALEARSTAVASWIPLALRAGAVGQDGRVYLPGAEIPAAASPLHLLLEVEEPEAEAWRVQLLDPWNRTWLEAGEPRLDASFELPEGELRYLRVTAWIGGEEQRLWTSPFFGADP